MFRVVGRVPEEAGEEGPKHGHGRDAGADRRHAPRSDPSGPSGVRMTAVHLPHPFEVLPLAPLESVLQGQDRRDEHQRHQDGDDRDDQGIDVVGMHWDFGSSIIA